MCELDVGIYWSLLKYIENNKSDLVKIELIIKIYNLFNNAKLRKEFSIDWI